MAGGRRRSALRKGSAVARGYRQIVSEQQALRSDYPRRLRNALAVLTEIDSQWLWWVECHVPRDADLESQMRMVERRAKTLLIEQSYWTMDAWAKRRIIEGERCFGEDGVLV